MVGRHIVGVDELAVAGRMVVHARIPGVVRWTMTLGIRKVRHHTSPVATILGDGAVRSETPTAKAQFWSFNRRNTAQLISYPVARTCVYFFILKLLLCDALTVNTLCNK